MGEVADWSSGGTPRRTQQSYYGGDIPWAVIGDLNDETVTECKDSITHEGLSNSNCKIVDPGTIFVAMYGSIGKLGIAGLPIATNQAIASAVPHIDNLYLFYFLLAQRSQLTEAGKGATQRNISQTILKAWPIPVAPPKEQVRIVATIEEHFSRLAAASGAITAAQAKIEATRRSVLVAAFAGSLATQDLADEPAPDLMSRVAGSEPAESVGRRTLPSPRGMTDRLPPSWVWARFDEVATTQLGKMLSAKSRQGKAPVPYLRNQNVQWHRIDLSDVASMDFTDNERVKYQLRPGDLLICEGGEVGRAAMWTQPSVEMCFQKALHRVRARPGIEARWIEYFMRWSAQTGRFEEHAQGSTIAHLPQRDLRALMVPIPPTKEQRRIVAAIEEYLSRLDAASDAMTVARARIEATRRSVLVEAFTGRLTRQDRPMNQRKI